MKNIAKINLALSDQPLYVAINDPNMSLDSVFAEAVANLRESGQSHEATQLETLYSDHQVFSGGEMQTKGLSFNQLPTETRDIAGETINFVELELLKQHTGGGMSLNVYNCSKCGCSLHKLNEENEWVCYECENPAPTKFDLWTNVKHTKSMLTNRVNWLYKMEYDY